MKKSKLFLCVLLAATMLFASCGKDEPETPNNNNPGVEEPTPTPTPDPDPDPTPDPELTHNELIIGTDHYMMESDLSITNDGVYLFGASDPNGLFSIIADVPSSMLGQTVDLAQLSSSDHFYINFYSTNLSFILQCGDEPINEINGEEVNAVFTNGTMKVTKENGIVICQVSGTLSNGTFVGFMMNVDVVDIQAMDSQVVVDGQPYPADINLNHENGNVYDFWISGQGEGAVTVNVIIEENNIGQTVNLSMVPGPFYYVTSIYFLDLGVTAQQTSLGSGAITSSYWDVPSQSTTYYAQNECIFSRGTIYTEEDDYAIGMTFIGTLTNGHTVSTQMRIDKTKIN